MDRRRAQAKLISILSCGLFLSCSTQEPRVAFQIEEATIREIHEAMKQGLKARDLIEAYLARIEAYDKTGPALNAIIRVNPRARARADELDAQFAESGFVGPLHGIVVIIKDNYDTHDMPTSAGSLSLAESVPPDDAFQVRKLREAGAIVLAKANMSEFAFSGYETIGSAMAGYTRNPYATNRVPAGSSGGTAAAIAANFATVGLGTDTGNSIRGPSSHNCLVGIRSTMGLTSRDGIVPLFLDRDIGGPMTRTLEDAVAVLDVIAGHDPSDPVTEASEQHKVDSYRDSLVENGLKGARIGVLRQLSDTETTSPEVLERFEEALQLMSARGATIVDAVHVKELDEIELRFLWCRRFKHDLDGYLAGLGSDAPYKSLEEIVSSGLFHHSVAPRLRESLNQAPPDESEGCRTAADNATRLRTGVQKILAENKLDALVYPSWSNPPRLIGDLRSPHGNNSPRIAPHAGFPAITIPMGFVAEGLPVGLQILGDVWSEPRLIAIGYGFEQATKHRLPPDSTPSLDRNQ